MRYLLRLSLVFIIMTLSCSTASADKYSRAWKKVNAYLEKDLPESAAKEINNIWDMAAQDGDGRQMLKSAVYLTSVQQTFQENSITDGIELFKTLLPKLTVQEHQALCHAFLVEGYKCFRDNNLNLLRHNRETDDPDAPINMWTIKMITDTICYHLNQSINLAGDVAAGYYANRVPKASARALTTSVCTVLRWNSWQPHVTSAPRTLICGNCMSLTDSPSTTCCPSRLSRQPLTCVEWACS